MVENLIKRGADVNSQAEESKWSPLHMVAWNGNKEIADILLKNGANLNIKTYFEWTPLHTAAYNGKLFAINPNVFEFY